MRKKLTLKGLWKSLKLAATGFMDDKILKLSAALAYYTVFSLGPMFIVILFITDITLGKEAIEGRVYGQIAGLVGSEAAVQIQEMIRNSALSNKGPLAAIIGGITLLIGATGVFAEIQDSINQIWGLKAKTKKGWLKMLMNRLVSFSIVVSLGFLLLVSLVINGLLEGMMDRLKEMFPNLAVVVVYIINIIITFGVTTLLFGIIFKVLPDAKIKWRDVIIGSMATAILFMIGKFAITFYIGSSDIGSTYGAAGSLVVLLVWVYYSSLILYFGAEFTKAYAANYGSRILPNNYAVWIKQVEVEEENGSLKQMENKKHTEDKETPDNVHVK
ncbi:MAG TPA: YihY/virulence factor BrkB family protein [Chitinophagaceae bacterium]|nr:YihY/virulence factor BrkB family protein [Chitinophagaceae bacterium]